MPKQKIIRRTRKYGMQKSNRISLALDPKTHKHYRDIASSIGISLSAVIEIALRTQARTFTAENITNQIFNTPLSLTQNLDKK